MYAKLILPHVALVLLTCAYTVLGASIFYTVERPHEMESKQRHLREIYSQQDKFVNNLIRLASVNTTGRMDWELVAQQHLHNMSDKLFVAFEKYFLTSIEVGIIWNVLTIKELYQADNYTQKTENVLFECLGHLF
ncbi:hypothetical protein ANCCAN_28543 [Ancylostoma caninum]|uniref:Uncharacterized protein n=1 Tax=Ancylostoma caninum TaxID=29170 RepID=A0A368F0X6_ANCCA|nr:hypothetical protein ANCCAN_28543 [Ancylostoma caninum]